MFGKFQKNDRTIGFGAALLFFASFGCRYAASDGTETAMGTDTLPNDTDTVDAPPSLNVGRNLPFNVTIQAGCDIDIVQDHELMITNLDVVEDIQRTHWNGDVEDPISGAWSFGRLMTAMAGPVNASEFVTRWFQIWRNTVYLNGAEVAARNGLSGVMLGWPRTGTGELDLTQSPMRLLAITNRIDLADETRAGEGRFVFGLTEDDAALEFALNLEYSLPLDVMSKEEWAEKWHALGEFDVGTPEYNAALQEVTDAFTGIDTDELPDTPYRPTDISQIVTNENEFGNGIWEMREFNPDGTGQLAMRTLPMTPAWGFNSTVTLIRYLQEYEQDILAGTYEVPLEYQGDPFRAAAVKYSGEAWDAPDVNPEARHLLSLNSCNGCHGGETFTDFIHVQPREEGEESVLSGFLTGIEVLDPIDKQTVRHFDDLDRRADAMRAILCE